MRFSRAILNALLATSLAAGVAVAQDAPPPPDSQYPASNDVAQSTPQYERQSDPVYATPNSQTSEPTADSPEEGGYPQSASAPPAPSGDMGAMNGPESDDDSQDPSSRVARMQFMDGQVSIQPGGVNDWVAGTLNRPMTTGDNVWTDKDSRSELNVGTGIFRMGAETSVTLANVADKTTQLQLHQGTLNLRVRHLYDGEVYEIDTPNAAFTVQKPGDYRFDVDPNADTTYITVWKGEGNATGDGPSVEVREHEKARFSNGTSMAYEINKAGRYDQFDEWAMGRDERIDHSKSAKYVSPDVIGSSDLDDYGTWKENSEYGNVWVPNDQGDDFEPYSNGNWIYQQPYGWTWVGYEPWGFAPYHYGRWVQGGWGWGWAPGPYAYWGSPYYAPAMVAWFGGPGFGIGWGGGFGFGGGWGWCALGWGEPFHPWYHGGRGYFNRVNIHNTRITNINNYYNNRGRINNHYANAGRGLVATNGRTISNGMPVRNNRVSLNNSQRAQMTQHPAANHELGNQLRPTAQGRVGAQAASRHATAPPSRATTRQTVSHLAPPNRGSGMNRGAGMNNASARGNGGLNTPRPSAGMNNGRNGGAANNGAVNNNARSFGGANNGRSNNVPRPPSAGGQTNGGQMNHNTPGGGNSPRSVTPTNRGTGNTATNGHYVPRPPSAGGTIGNRGSSNMPSAMARSNNNVARPGGAYSRPGQSYSAPRSSGPTSQPSRNYSSPNPSRSYSSPSYGGNRGYSSPSPNYGRSYSSPNPGRSYSSPSPSYGGGRAYSAPSYGGSRGYSAPSGGGHYSAPAPAYHGGGGGYSGGGHSGGGGGGHASGGGGHASGGGGGHSGGGRH